MSYSYQSEAKNKIAQKEKQFLSNYAKHSFICNWIKPGNFCLPDPCQRGPAINVGTGPRTVFSTALDKKLVQNSLPSSKSAINYDVY